MRIAVEVLKVEEGFDRFKMEHQEKLLRSVEFKDRGNELFAAKRTRRAEWNYEEGSKFFTLIKSTVGDDTGNNLRENRELAEAAVPLYLNLALCKKSRNAWKEAESDLKECLLGTPDLGKIHFRLGQVHVGMDLWDDAKADFKKAAALDPTCQRNVNKELVRMRKLALKQNKKDSKVFSEAFETVEEAGGHYAEKPLPKPDVVKRYKEIRKKDTVPLKIGSLAAEFQQISDDEDDARVQKKEDWYNMMIQSGQMALTVPRDPDSDTDSDSD